MTSSKKNIKNYLKISIKKNKISHAYLFEGPSLPKLNSKLETAIWFANQLQQKENSPDTVTISTAQDKKEINIKQIRKLRTHLSLSPYNSPYKVAIIEKAHQMTKEAKNALLKTLEEPKGNTVLILITNASYKLPDTVLSRCEKIKFKAPSLNDISKDFIQKEYVDVLNDPIYEIFNYIEKIYKNKNKILEALDSWTFWFRDLILKQQPKTKYSKQELADFIKQIQNTKNLILETNLNPRLALEDLILKIKK